jgi:sulfide:quinone oxidoreductase
MSDSGPCNVLIVGGGTAALEAVFHLQRVAGRLVSPTILAPDDHFATRAMAVLSPFAAGRSPDASLARLASDAGARLRRGRMASVDAADHHVMTTAGEAIPYDALLIAVGGVPRIPFRDALAFGGPGTEERMHGLVQDVEDGYVRRIAFVVPPGATWPVPLYELALMTAERAFDMCQTPDLTLFTPEAAPLGLFGSEASDALTARLAATGVAVRTGVDVSVPRRGVVQIQPGRERLTVDRVVTLPTLDGRAVRGLPQDAHGFLPVDRHCRVLGAADVYAAGDATHFPIKQGGLACQQADAAAEAIAAHAGAAIEPKPYAPKLQGVLLTERTATFLRRVSDGDSTSDEGFDWPPSKIAGRELALHLGASGI